MSKAPVSFHEEVESIRKVIMPDADADRIHDLNTLASLQFTTSTATTPAMMAQMPAAGHLGYLTLMFDRSRAFLVVAAALSRLAQETARELHIEIPPELEQLGDFLSSLSKGEGKSNASRAPAAHKAEHKK